MALQTRMTSWGGSGLYGNRRFYQRPGTPLDDGR